MLLDMEPKVSPLPLHPKVALAVAARRRGLKALVALAKALGTPDSVPAALGEAKAALSEGEDALKQLDGALVAPGAAPGAVPGVSGDEDEERLRHFGDKAEAMAREFEEEQGHLRQCQWWLRVGQGVAMGLMVLCSAVLSLGWARAALGVTEDGHLPLALGAAAAACEVALRGLGTSRRHLAAAADQQRQLALRFRRRAKDVLRARATDEAAGATNKATVAVMRQLEDVTETLEMLVDAVDQDREMWGRGFPESARNLADIAVTLGTLEGEGDEEVTRRLRAARRALVGHV